MDITTYSSSCNSQSQSKCIQTTRLNINPETLCTLSGSYEINTTTVCRDGSKCNSSVSLLLQVIGENFCSTIEIDISVIATLRPYGDKNYTTVQSNYYNSGVVYFRADLSATKGAVLSSSVLKSVVLQNQLNPSISYTLYSTNITSIGSQMGFGTPVGGFDWVGFQYNLGTNYTTPLSNQILLFKVIATITVSYSGNQKKRFSMDTEVSDAQSSTQLLMSLQPQVIVVVPEDVIIGIVVGCAAAVVIALTLGLVLNYYFVDAKTKKYATLDHLALEINTSFGKAGKDFNFSLPDWIPPWQSRLNREELDFYKGRYDEKTQTLKEKGREKLTFKSENEIRISQLILDVQDEFVAKFVDSGSNVGADPIVGGGGDNEETTSEN